ncbi:MAG TPA: nucleotide exchange factor GrpE [Polyangiaceae bacterium]|nr:nucleotide exchange factor GrpE [Polyangiaceae bacterium]
MTESQSETNEHEDDGDPTATVEDAAISPVTLLEMERDKAIEERDQRHERLLRVSADFDNFRKRSRKDVEQAERRGRETILRELLPVFDNLERAANAAEDAEDIQAVRDGVQMVLKLFTDTAARLDLTRVESVGQRFDPNVHDAFQQVETTDAPAGTVVQEYQPGYQLAGKLLRPAMVVVARAPVSTEEEE